jgi:hypothetical protein
MSENLCAEPIEVSPEKFHLDKGKTRKTQERDKALILKIGARRASGEF